MQEFVEKPMANIVEQLQELRQKRHEAAQRKYSEILLRFDAPREDDAEEIDRVMVELRIDAHGLEHDMHVMRKYRDYLNAPEGDSKKTSSLKTGRGKHP